MSTTRSGRSGSGGRRILGVGLCAIVACLSGCAPQGPGPVDRPVTPDGASAAANPGDGASVGPATDAWPYWPRSMRLHPLSRFVQSDDGGWVIEARVELFDRDGVSTRGAGALRLWIRPCEAPASAATSWVVNLRDPLVNRERYDAVTRMYLLRLSPEDLLSADVECVALSASFTGADGARMDAAPLQLER